MKMCRNPACRHQVEDDAIFCGMCGTYVGTEMPSNTAPADIRQFVATAASNISEWDLPETEVKSRTEAILQALEQAERLGATQPDLATATADAYALLLQMDVENQYITARDAILRMKAIEGLNRTARMMVITHRQSVSSEVLSILTTNLPDLIHHRHYLPPRNRVDAARTYMDLLSTIVSREPTRKEELRLLARQFSSACGSQLDMLDPTRLASNKLFKLLAELRAK